MKYNVFPDRSQTAEQILASNSPDRVFIVPIDLAKDKHVAQICRATGQFLFKRSMTIYNTTAGAEYLLKRIRSNCSKFRIPPGNVLLASEDPAEYAYNFLHYLRRAGMHVVRVNAHEAKKYRTNTRASSDKLDLNGIAQAVICRRAYDPQQPDGIYAVMKTADRARRKLVRDETSTKNRIHRCVEILFPGFLNEKNTGLTPFGKASLSLMSQDFSVMRFKRMQRTTLVRRLQPRSVQSPQRSADKIKELAERTLHPPSAIVPYYTSSLETKVELLQGIRKALKHEENELARCLVQTPAFFLTSIPGIGVIRAAGIAAQLGDTDRWPPADQIASYAGIVPREEQTGGPDKKAHTTALPIACNHPLKDCLLQAAFHTGSIPHPAWQKLHLPGQHPLRRHYQRMREEDRYSGVSTAKKLLKIARAMVRERRIYLPPHGLDPTDEHAMSTDQYIEYHLIVLDILRNKWKAYDLNGIPEEQNYLKSMEKQIHGLAEHRTSVNT